MKYKILSFLILSFVFQSKIFGQAGQGTKAEEGMPANGYEKVIINGIKIDKDIVESLQFKTKRSAEPLKFYYWKDSIIDSTNYGYWDTISHGIVFKNVKENWARSIQDQYVTGNLRADSLYIYLTNLYIDSLKNSFYDIAIIKAVTQFDAIKRVGTCSKNYDITNEEIIEKLKLWDKELAFKIMVIDKNRIEARMQFRPKNIEKFVVDVYEFWPDAVELDYGSKEAMIKYYDDHLFFKLWWEME